MGGDGVEDLQHEILERIVRIETKLDNYNATKERADEAYSISKQNCKEIQEMKDNQKWLWRTTLGAIIAGVISVFIKFKIGN